MSAGRVWTAFAGARRVVVFVLGVLVVIDSLIGDHDNLGELAIGAVMVGVLPLDGLLAWATSPWHAHHRAHGDDDTVA